MMSAGANGVHQLTNAAGVWGQLYDRLNRDVGAWVVVYGVVVSGALPRSVTWSLAISLGPIVYPPTGAQTGLKAWDNGVLATAGGEGDLMNGPGRTIFVPAGCTLHVTGNGVNPWRFTCAVLVDGVLPAVKDAF